MQKQTPYFGSVKFFKHVIYLSLALLGFVVFSKLYSYSKEHFTERTFAAIPSANLLSDGETSEQTFTAPNYQSKYPELYSSIPKAFRQEKEKVAYLTFDDGPSIRTLEILELLKAFNIKATFFVVTEGTDLSILKRIAQEGHSIGIHCHSHEYKKLYASTENFLEDLHTAYNKIYQATSIKPRFIRFPGGSINAYNSINYQEIISEVLRRGFLYYDWNVSTGDAASNPSLEQIMQNIKASVNGQDKLIILAHDSEHKTQTVAALPKIIEFLTREGYTFDRLEPTVKPIIFAYP